ncbi:uncharacterized protein LOC122374195 [Amphibalanus amphitrite]|uniref:uncharacterized protein LOC122374195 n=1 Tax=Amphibalanus amphitrite TaxID=1232801 RepID=UPI001C8FC4F7|nr:uncharacterized protein LOC122374195 [Amphibalanus amphitrite]
MVSAAAAAALCAVTVVMLLPPPCAAFVGRGEVQLPAQVQCPSGMYSDPDTPQLKVTHLCVPTRRRGCVPGTSWRERCATCSCPSQNSGPSEAVCQDTDCQEDPALDWGDTRLCGRWSADCPAGCRFALRDWRCTYCNCAAPPTPAAETTAAPPGAGCAPGTGPAWLCSQTIRVTDRRAPPGDRQDNSRLGSPPPEALTSLTRAARGSDGGWTSIKEAGRMARARAAARGTRDESRGATEGGGHRSSASWTARGHRL